jgi:hypothetical protein
MQSRRLLVLVGSLLVVSFELSGASAQTSTPFAITATDVTMPSSGIGVSQYTVTGIPAAGTLAISCAYSGPVTVAKLPLCPMTPPVVYTVTAGETLTGQIDFYPYGSPIPVGLHRMPSRSSHLPAASLAFAGALIFGFGLRSRARRWLALILLATGMLAGLAGISGCIPGNPMTPGTYQYTISADWTASSPAILSAQTTTNISVTVP